MPIRRAYRGPMMADGALPTADASELARYLSHVYRQPISNDHAALINASTSTMQWLWNFAPMPRTKLCVHRRERNVTALCAAHSRLPAGAVGISMISPNLGLTRLEKFGVALPPCTRAGSVATPELPIAQPRWDAPVVRAGEEAFVEVIRIDYAAYVRGMDFFATRAPRGGRGESVTAMDKEGGPNGCWFLTQRGSGVFVRAGRVLRVADRSELVERLNISLVHRGKRHRRDDLNFINRLEDSMPLCPHVRSHGFDTLIFDNREGLGVHELVSCQRTCIEHKLNGSCVPELRTGWGASLPCSCNGSLPVVNCALTGVDQVGPWPAIRHHYAGGFQAPLNVGRWIPRWPVMPTVRLPMCKHG